MLRKVSNVGWGSTMPSPTYPSPSTVPFTPSPTPFTPAKAPSAPYGGGKVPSAGGGTPPTPYWLPSFSPRQTEGQPMGKYPVKIPSGQLWSKTPWSQRGGLESYINWAAGTPGVIAAYQDMLDRMMMMLPQRSPSRAGRWAVPRQW